MIHYWSAKYEKLNSGLPSSSLSQIYFLSVKQKVQPHTAWLWVKQIEVELTSPNAQEFVNFQNVAFSWLAFHSQLVVSLESLWTSRPKHHPLGIAFSLLLKRRGDQIHGNFMNFSQAAYGRQVLFLHFFFLMWWELARFTICLVLLLFFQRIPEISLYVLIWM